MQDCLIAFGSNLGDSEQIFTDVQAALKATAGCVNVMSSPALITKPVGGPAGQSAFHNACVWFETNLSAWGIIQALRTIEAELGRVRHERWGPRTVDLDLLLLGDTIVNEKELMVPHPRMSFRRFVLEPAAALVPGMLHPPSGLVISGLLQRLNERGNLATLVTSGLVGLDELVDSARAICKEFDFELQVATLTSEQQAWQDSKLVVFCWSDDQSLVDRAFRFPGATLPLEKLTVKCLEEELSAAFQAMKRNESGHLDCL